MRSANQITEAIIINAVMEDWQSLQVIDEQTEAICMAAVETNGMALKYVHEKTRAICHQAVESDYRAIQFVSDPSHRLCCMALDIFARKSDDWEKLGLDRIGKLLDEECHVEEIYWNLMDNYGDEVTKATFQDWVKVMLDQMTQKEFETRLVSRIS